MATAFEDIKFPAYRKYKNNRSYFKIINAQEFEEIQIIGSRRLLRRTEARQFPEKRFIHELLYEFEKMADVIEAAEYEVLRAGIDA